VVRGTAFLAEGIAENSANLLDEPLVEVFPLTRAPVVVGEASE
jgi:hypothetical protein